MSKLPYGIRVRVKPHVHYFSRMEGETTPPEEMAPGGSCMDSEVIRGDGGWWLAIKAEHLEIIDGMDDA